MENTEKIFAKPILSLNKRLSSLNGFLSILDNQLNLFRDRTIKAFEETEIDISAIASGYALIIQDLSEQSEKNKVPFFPIGSFIRRGEEYFLAADDLIAKWSEFTLAQVFEAFESYTRDQAATLFWIFPPKLPVGKLRHMPINVSDYCAWQSFFRERRWDIFSILDMFRKHSPKLKILEHCDSIDLNLLEWLKILGAIRHAVTHSNSLLSKDDIRIDQNQAKLLLRNNFPGEWEGDTYNLSITPTKATKNIEIAASYAHLIYKTLALSAGLRGDEIGTQKYYPPPNPRST